METHTNHNYADFKRQWDRLQERTEEAVQNSASAITAGLPDEPTLGVYRFGKMEIVLRPPDEQKIIRISVGGKAPWMKEIEYCVIRGDLRLAAQLLRQAALGLELIADRKLKAVKS